MHFNQTALHTKKNRAQLLRIVNKVIKSGIFLEGRQNLALEKKLSQILGFGFVTTCASGHDSLFLAIKSLNLNKDDEVIFPVNSYPTAHPLSQASVKLVPVDVDENGQIDPKEIVKKITKNTKVIVTVHLYGLVGDFEYVIKLARNNKIYLIEDAAQSFGTRFQNKAVGL